MAIAGLFVLALLVLDRCKAVLRWLHMRGNAVHVRRRCDRFLCGTADFRRAGRRLQVEVEVIVAEGLRGSIVDKRVTKMDARWWIHGQHGAGWVGTR